MFGPEFTCCGTTPTAVMAPLCATGFEAARFERVAFTDADCQFHPSDLACLLPLTEDHPIAVGYRQDRQDSRWRCFVSWGYNTVVRLLLGTRVRDCDCALKVFHRDVLARLLPRSRGFFVNTEMLTRARQMGCSVAEVGVRHRPRADGQSKVSLADVPRVLKTLVPFWWNQVLFPGSRTEEEATTGRQGGLLVLPWTGVLVALVAALLFFSRLGCPLQEPQEVRYAEIPRQMLAEGHWLVPVLNGQPYLEKPPLLYWLGMLSYHIFGVHDGAIRLISSGAGFLTVLLTWWWGRRTAGAWAGLAGALILCLSGRFLYLQRLLTMDALLTAWVVAGLAMGHIAMRSSSLRWGWWLLSALACGLGLLTKGPIALVLVGPPLLGFQVLDARICRPAWRPWLAYLALALAVAAPWYAAVALVQPGFLTDFFWHHHVVRFLEPFDHQEPAWFYLPGLLLALFPWSLLLPGLVWFVVRHSRRVAARRPSALGFFLLAFLGPLLFFSAAGCKRPTYVLPVLPPLALALGCFLQAWLIRYLAARPGSVLAERGAAYARWATRGVLVLAIVAILMASRTGLLPPFSALLLAGAALAGLLFSRSRWPVRPGPAWGLCLAVLFAFLLTGIWQFLPGFTGKFSLRDQVRPLAERVRKESLPVVCYPRRWDSVSYYLHRDDVRAFTAQQRPELIATLRQEGETLMFVKSGRPMQEFLGALPPGMEFVPHGRQGTLTAGVVRYRREPLPSLYAGVP